ncbi:outer membrane protein [Aurantiacibacter poecillastricola]|uniref:outer membrane protein n=1 Tax=Aurantiacibacter poecillastricola TaxID=3064385 RepID=UPI00273F1680|nr:porin family protein [Aurantiacibacter sp. 219JJ12-13]MDP5263177.1 porin family protein [Aurantiacibacter sp. 219JJ12-13]
MKKLAVITALSASLFATPAFAQEASVVSGPRIEVLAGWDRVSTGADETSDFDTNEDGFAFGVGAGYDFVAGSVLIGLEAEIAESTTGISYSAVNEVIEGSVVSGTIALDAAEDIYVGGRVGTVLGETTVLYVKGGYSMAAAELSIDGTIDGERVEDAISADFDGLRVGAGVETAFTGGLFVKAEYRYSPYSGVSMEYDDVSVDLDEAFDYIDVDRHQVVVGVGYRF